MAKINGKKLKNKGHRVGPYPVFRNVEEEVQVPILDDDDNPVIDEATGEPKTETQTKWVEHVYHIFAVPVWSFEKFNNLYPRPQPPVGGWSPVTKEKEHDFKDPQYLQDLEDYGLAREGWAMMTSLAPSNLELEVLDENGEETGQPIDMSKPQTWKFIKASLRGMFSFYEYNRIIDLMDEACGINDEKIAENRETFLSEQQALSSGRTKV